MAVGCFAFCSTLGCSETRPKTYPVTGVVLFASGAPLRSGFVELIPLVEGPSARGKIGPNGKFTLGTHANSDGAAAGDYVALVTQLKSPVSSEMARKLGPEHQEHAHETELVSLKYSSRTSSDLKCSVSSSAENYLELTVDAQIRRGGSEDEDNR